jgi:hypothetical protein
MNEDHVNAHKRHEKLLSCSARFCESERLMQLLPQMRMPHRKKIGTMSASLRNCEHI